MYNLENITSFLRSHGWACNNQTRLFDVFMPPIDLNLPDDYSLYIPNNQNDNGFIKYMNSVIETLCGIYGEKYSSDDFKTFFASENAIFSLKIIDNDTQYGAIRLERLKNAVNQMFISIKQAVIFSVSNQPIFGNAKHEVNQYMYSCRAKQTEFGSYVVKFELPENYSTLTKEHFVPELLFKSIEFLTEILSDIDQDDINSDFILKNKTLIN